MDNSQAGKGDGTVSTLELRRGLAALTNEKSLKEFKYSEADLNNLLRYMDPSGDGELDMQEVGDALRRAHMDPQSAKEEEQAGGIIKRLGEIMLERQCRILDLYRILDEDGSGSITLNELRDGLIKFAQPSGEERAQAKRAGNAEAAASAAAKKAAEEDAILQARLTQAKESGAYNVLMKCENHMHANGMRVIDLFSKSGFDKSGDGVLDEGEFTGALGWMGIDMSKEEVKLGPVLCHVRPGALFACQRAKAHMHTLAHTCPYTQTQNLHIDQASVWVPGRQW